MKRSLWIALPILLAVVFTAGVTVFAQGNQPAEPLAPASFAFTYQGRLNKDDQPVNDNCSIYTTLWDSASGGSSYGSFGFSSVPVVNGLFTVQLNFGTAAFTGEARWLETAVKCTGDANYSTLSPRTELTAAPYAAYALGNWGLTGNSGAGSANFLGTRDDMPLNLGANGQVALRLQPNPNSPNITGGSSYNYISPTIYGGTISGGGQFFYENRVMSNFGSVGGGRGNHADSYGSTIGGGIDNQATGDYAVVAGGLHNYATGSSSAIGGGFYNVASGYVSYVGGGDLNLATTQNATIGGGYSNTVSGGQLIANGTIGGGVFNVATGFAATIAGGHGNRAAGEWASMSGGGFNTASTRSATVGGGEYNAAGGSAGTIGGGAYNTAVGASSTIGGGRGNTADGAGSTIGGGGWNGSASTGNQARGAASTIGGGYGSLISADGGYGVIGGGQQNVISAAVGTNLGIATIGGGYNNRVSLGGGTIAGGNSNSSSGFDASVGGGNGNLASGGGAMVPGGISNLAQGNTSFAAGLRAKSYNHGCFTWADANNFDYGCSINNAFTARATGGVFFVTGINGSGGTTAGVTVAAGGNSWATLSDRNSKTDVAAVDNRQLLEKLAQVPITSWRYKTQDSDIRHIGPMAQDFRAAFGLGEDDTHINTIDTDGVSLAAIQGLYEISQEKDAQIARQQGQVEVLEAQVAALRRQLDALDPASAAQQSPLALNLSTVLSLGALAGVALLWARGRGGARR